MVYAYWQKAAAMSAKHGHLPLPEGYLPEAW